MISRFRRPQHLRRAILIAAILAVPVAALAQDDPKLDPKVLQPKKKLLIVTPDGEVKALDSKFTVDDSGLFRHPDVAEWRDPTAADPIEEPNFYFSDKPEAKAAMDAQQSDVALKLLDAVVKLRPDYVEAWNRRATLYYLQNDYAHSLADIQQVLVREPRHFGALAGLGMIMRDLGDDKRALDAFRKALAINPHLEKVPELVKTLSEKVEGRDI